MGARRAADQRQATDPLHGRRLREPRGRRVGGVPAPLANAGGTPAGADVTKPGVVGYLDALYASPGDEIVLRVSVLDGGGRYRASLARLICGETGPGGPGLKEEAIGCAID